MILFDVSKHETHYPSANYRSLSRRLKSITKVQVNKEILTPTRLEDCEALVIASPQSRFSSEELRLLKSYVDGGGSLVVFSSDGGSQPPNSNLTELTQMFGIRIDRTTLVRTVYYKYLHPKYALIQNGVVQPEIGVEKFTSLNGTTNECRAERNTKNNRTQVVSSVDSSTSLSFVYPNGTTLGVQSPAYTLLSSGSTSYPVDCPIAAAWESTDSNPGGRQGRVLVVGSSDIFADEWIEKEENSQLCNVLFRFVLCSQTNNNIHASFFSFDPSLGRSNFEEIECVPDISSLSQMVKPCLEESDPLPQDYVHLLCEDLFGLHNNYVPEVVNLYERLNVPYEPLTLVEPEFVCPHLPYQWATHRPRMMDHPPPALELFDLDECFIDMRFRLATITNRFVDDTKLDKYIEEAGSLVGVIVNKEDTTDDDNDNDDEGDGDGLVAKQYLRQIVQKLLSEGSKHLF